MIPLNASQVTNDVAGKIGNACGAQEANLNEFLQQQIVVDNAVRSGPTSVSIESQCLDLQTGKIDAGDALDFQDPELEKSEVPDMKGATLNDTQLNNEQNLGLGDDKISYEIHTRNESLEGEQHPITGVQFEQKTVEDAEGNAVTGVFPEFESKFDAQLPEDKLQASDSEQFTECNKQLKDAIDNDSELTQQFTPEQQEQIQNGDTPDGYTWHHNEVKGKMQLVDSQIHAQTGHTGGRSIWGGGSENR